MGDRDPLTCHVLNTYTGSPAAGLTCVLTLISLDAEDCPASRLVRSEDGVKFTATTDADGRVKKWQPSSPSVLLPDTTLPVLFGSFPGAAAVAGGERRKTRSVWSIKFLDVDGWYRERGVGDCFWPEVEVRFVVEGKEGEEGWRHYHVPVLLGPWNYSTYRGS